MTRTYTAGNAVKGGFYLNRDDWTMFVAPAEGGVLPGEPGARYAAFSTLVMLLAACVVVEVALLAGFVGRHAELAQRLRRQCRVWKIVHARMAVETGLPSTVYRRHEAVAIDRQARRRAARRRGP